MENTNPTSTAPVGGVAVKVDPDTPGQGWLEILVSLDDVHLYPSENVGEVTQVGLQFDYLSGSVCSLLATVKAAHDHLVAQIGAQHA